MRCSVKCQQRRVSELALMILAGKVNGKMGSRPALLRKGLGSNGEAEGVQDALLRNLAGEEGS